MGDVKVHTATPDPSEGHHFGSWRDRTRHLELLGGLRDYRGSMERGQRFVFRYGGVVALVGLSVILGVSLIRLIGIEQPAAFLLIAVGVTGWFLGFRPSIVGVVLSALVLINIYRWHETSFSGLMFFIAEGLGIALLVNSQRKTHFRWQEKDALAAKLLNEYEAELVERKRAQAAEQRHSLWLEVTLSSIADGLVATDESGIITYVNPVAREILALKAGEAEGEPEESVFRFEEEDTGAPISSPIAVALGRMPPHEGPEGHETHQPHPGHEGQQGHQGGGHGRERPYWSPGMTAEYRSSPTPLPCATPVALPEARCWCFTI